MKKKSYLKGLVNPSLSIVICNYNNAPLLDRAIRSAIEQTQPCEVVVVDDGSTDCSLQVAEKWADRVKVVSKTNGGQISAYERGFEETSGDLINFLDSDDFLFPEAAEKVAARFSDGVAKVHFRLSVVDILGRSIGVTIPSSTSSGDVLGPMLKTGVLYTSAPGSGNVYRRDVVRHLIPLPGDSADPHGADLFVVYGSVFFGSAVALDEVLGGYCVHLSPEEQAKALTFGNAEQRPGAEARFYRRLDRFRDWIDERTDRVHALPRDFLDFGSQKAFFAVDTVGAGIFERLEKAKGHVPRLFKSIWMQESYSLLKRIILSIWVGLVVLFPAALARPIARYVCNPFSRGR